VQVDPIELTLKAPGIKRLNLKCDEPLSNYAFRFNLRRYNPDVLRLLNDPGVIAALKVDGAGPPARGRVNPKP
jgi:hypothetical protein